jgi:DNA-binding response OmpR family regulator
MRVLAVDDELGFLRLIDHACKEAGMTCTGASSAGEAVNCVREAGPGYFDAVLLDVGMPEVDGWECCTLLRQVDPQIPVVFLTTLENGNEADRGLTLGAEDIIAKPTSFGILVGRLKYFRDRHERTRSIRAGRLRLNLVRHSMELDGKPIELTLQEFKVLLELVLARGATLSKAALLERVWHAQSDPGTNRVEVHVANLRRKTRVAGVDVIQTVWGEGYALRMLD